MINIIDKIEYLDESDPFNKIYNSLPLRIVEDIIESMNLINSTGYEIEITLTGRVDNEVYEIGHNFEPTENIDLNNQILEALKPKN